MGRGGASADFVALIRDRARGFVPLDPGPLPVDFAAREFPTARGSIPGIKAVLLDVYGTLFSSAAGDIGADRAAATVAGPAAGAGVPSAALDELAAELAPTASGQELRAFFRSAVLSEHERLSSTTVYPEVRVEELWARCGLLRPGTDPLEAALRYELAVNPVSPMPGLQSALTALRGAGYALGIVSNAQFFTPLLFEAYLGAPLELLGFDPALLVYSFQRREAKPSVALFQAAVDVLAARGIQSTQTLYVGNDLLNDVHAAAAAGLRTCLFAGDARSLRLRRDDPRCAGTLPDAVIRRLADLPGLLIEN